MKNILKNSIVLLIFIILLFFKDYFYSMFDKKEYNFNFVKEKELEYYKNEYEKLINIKNDNNYLISKVIFRSVYNFYNEITISKGSNYDIKKGNPVVVDNTLIGVISYVDKKSSKVSLLYNKNVQLSVSVNNTYGILKSENNKLYVKNIIDDTKINVGDVVYTSGLTTIMPNIIIGKVVNIKTSEDKLERILEIKQDINVKDLDYVMIINNEERTD